LLLVCYSDMKPKVKELIQVRLKPLKDGRQSIYFDIYRNGERTYEFLKMYLLPKTVKLYAEKNKATLNKVEQIKAQRILDIQNGYESPADLSVSDAINLFLKEKSKTVKESSLTAYKVALLQLLRFCDDDIMLKDITIDMIKDYSSYLSSHCNYGTAKGYMQVFGIFITKMYRLGYYKKDVMRLLDNEYKPKGKSKEISYLTMEELIRFANVPTQHPIKDAFLFSCFTGLRYSDIIQLRWDDIIDGCIVKRQQKTSETVRIPLSENAIKHMPKRNGEFVFDLDKSKMAYCKAIKVIVRMAKIDKPISFHSGRHTFATLALTYGADIYTVSKLLGHKDISTTQRYAEVIDKKRVDAVNLIPKI